MGPIADWRGVYCASLTITNFGSSLLGGDLPPSNIPFITQKYGTYGRPNYSLTATRKEKKKKKNHKISSTYQRLAKSVRFWNFIIVFLNFCFGFFFTFFWEKQTKKNALLASRNLFGLYQNSTRFQIPTTNKVVLLSPVCKITVPRYWPSKFIFFVLFSIYSTVYNIIFWIIVIPPKNSPFHILTYAF